MANKKFSITYWRRPIANTPKSCGLLCVVYLREVRKRFTIMIPDTFEVAKVNKLDSRGRVINPDDYDQKTFRKLLRWTSQAERAVGKLLEEVAPAQVTKELIQSALRTEFKAGEEVTR